MYGRFFICCYFGLARQILKRAGFNVIFVGLASLIQCQNKEWMLVSKSGPRLRRLSFEVFVWSVWKLRKEIGKRQSWNSDDNRIIDIIILKFAEWNEVVRSFCSYAAVFNWFSQASLLLKQMLLLYKQSNWFHKQPSANSSWQSIWSYIWLYIWLDILSNIWLDTWSYLPLHIW